MGVQSNKAKEKKDHKEIWKCPTLSKHLTANMIARRRLVTGTGKDLSKQRKTTKPADKRSIQDLQRPQHSKCEIYKQSTQVLGGKEGLQSKHRRFQSLISHTPEFPTNAIFISRITKLSLSVVPCPGVTGK